MTAQPTYITVQIRPDVREFRAAMAEALYAIGRLGHVRHHRHPTPDTPQLVDMRDVAATLRDAAEGPAPWDRSAVTA